MCHWYQNKKNSFPMALGSDSMRAWLWLIRCLDTGRDI